MKVNLSQILFTAIIASGLTIFSSYAQDKNSFTTYWDNGIRIESQEGNFKFKIGGRIMYDVAFYYENADPADRLLTVKNGNEFRRLRFYHSGRIYGNVNYKIQADFAGAEIGVKDVYFEYSDIPVVGNLRIGFFKEPFRLETLTSSKYMTFMERSFTDIFSPTRNNGLMLYNDIIESQLSWQAGIFRNANGDTGDDPMADGGLVLTGRVTGLPVHSEDGDLLHLGVGYSYRQPDTRTYTVSARPESHLADKIITTGTLKDVENIHLWGVEAAWVLGSFSVQGELVTSHVKTKTDTASGPFNISTTADHTFLGYYGQVSYFLTGEKRAYKNSYSGFGRVRPVNNFGPEGPGAVEVALRHTAGNLNSGNLAGGELRDLSVGLNWHLNPASRIMANYVFANLKESSNVNVWQIRLQVDF